jgi:hypothetical protein
MTALLLAALILVTLTLGFALAIVAIMLAS